MGRGGLLMCVFWNTDSIGKMLQLLAANVWVN